MEPHPLWHLGNLVFNADTLIYTWITMAIVLVFALAAVRQMSVTSPRGLQNVLEYVWEFVSGFVKDGVNPEGGRRLMSLLVTLLLYLLVANLFGLIPGVHSPTADPNVVFGLAALVFVLTHAYSIGARGPLGYLKHYITPSPLFLPFTLLEELSKPITLAMRLFGNIFAGELLIKVLSQLFPLNSVGYAFGFITQVGWLGFSIFVGAVQAFVFMVLTLTYIGLGMLHEH